MKLQTRRALIFSLNGYLACVTAFSIASAFDLRRPAWAMITVYIMSLPLAGAILSKALYRILGTVAGVAVSLLIVPKLSPAPELLLLATALWTGAGLFMSLLYRGPHAYAFMLAGYTVALVGFPLVDEPAGIFDLVVARAEEICIGIACSAFFHGVFFPRTARQAVANKLGQSLDDMRSRITLSLSVASSGGEQQPLARFAADLTELTSLAAHLPFEPSAHHAIPLLVRAMERQLVDLLPLLGGVEDRMAALRRADALSPAVVEQLHRVATAIAQGDDNLLGQADKLLRSSRTPPPGPSSSWTDLLCASLLERLRQLINAWRRVLRIARVLADPHSATEHRVRALTRLAGARSLHADSGVAAWSGFAAAVGVLTTGVFAMLINWTDGAGAVGLAAVLCSLFATFDDPTPMIRRFLQMALVAIPAAAIYSFGILPAIDGLPLLYLAMAPVLIPFGVLMYAPDQAPRGIAFMILFLAGIGLTPNYTADFDSFVSGNLAAVVGGLIGLGVTNLIRVLRAPLVVRRILRSNWRDLAALAMGQPMSAREFWSSRMLDRQALLLPRLAQAQAEGGLQPANVLGDLRVGMNLMDLQALQQRLLPHDRRIAALMGQLEDHYLQQAAAGPTAPDQRLIGEIDAIIAATLRLDHSRRRNRGIAAAVGLRRSLFPGATPWLAGDAA